MLRLIAFLLLFPIVVLPQTKEEVLTAMKKATEFFSSKVANRGGYVWSVSEDFSRQYGEVPARKSQIWVQSGTPRGNEPTEFNVEILGVVPGMVGPKQD